jgi:hypothetical protein
LESVDEVEDLESNSSNHENMTELEPGVGKWVIASFTTKKSVKSYVGQIIKVPDQNTSSNVEEE